MSFTNQRTAPRQGRGKRPRPRNSGGVSTIPPFEAVADTGYLLQTCYHLEHTAGKATGIDRVPFAAVGRSEYATICRALNKALLGGTYRPQPNRPVEIPREGKSPRILEIPCVFDRVVGAAVAGAVSPFFETFFHDCSYAYRTGRNAKMMLAKLTRLVENHGLWVIGNNDIKSAFPSMPLDAVMAAHTKYIDDTRLLGLIAAILHGAEGDAKTIGLAQGSPYSPVASNLLLHEILDSKYSRDHSEPPLLRYSDNLVTLSSGAPESRRARARLEDLLAPHGLRLKTESTDGTEITHADLREEMTTQLLGFVISTPWGKLDFDLGPEWWARLEDNLKECHTLHEPHHRALQKLSGWINGAAPAFTSRRLASTVTRIMGITKEMGFREISEKTIRSQGMYAHDQWLTSLTGTSSGSTAVTGAWATAARSRSSS